MIPSTQEDRGTVRSTQNGIWRARSIVDLYGILDRLGQKGVKVSFLEQPELNSNSPQSKLMLGVLAAVADLRAARQLEGIKAAQARGVKFGRELKLTDDAIKIIRELRAEGKSIADVMAATGFSKSSVMRAGRTNKTANRSI